MDGSDRYTTGAKIRERFGVCNNTLVKYAEAGSVRTIRIGTAGKRLYSVEDIGTLFGGAARRDAEAPARARICYARVSSKKQEPDLVRQIEALKIARPGYEIVSDIGSGINWKRSGLLAILDRAMRGRVQEVVVAHRDRLCRFAFELLEHVLKQAGCRVVVLDIVDGVETESDERELTDDLMAVVTVFVASHNGRRSAIHKRARRQEEEASREGATARKEDQMPEVADFPEHAAEGGPTSLV